MVPTVSADQSSLTVVERTSAITLSCSVTGDPLPVLMWTRSGSPVTGSRSQISTDGRSLTISDVQVDDEGVYRCAGTNPGGSSSDTVSLNVIGKTVAILLLCVTSEVAMYELFCTNGINFLR